MLKQFAICIITIVIFSEGIHCFKYRHPYSILHGIAFPHEVEFKAGHDIQVQLWNTTKNQVNCFLKSPDFTKHNLNDNNNRFQKWGDCGVIIKDISEADIGYWTLISEAKDDIIEGIVSVLIRDKDPIISDEIDVEIINSDEPSVLRFGDQETSYCYLSQEGIPNEIMLSGNCSMNLNTTNENVQGTWKIYLGVPGVMEEETANSYVNVLTENVDAGYVVKDGVIYIHCNLVHSSRNISFCRFERDSDKKGFNLLDGIGKGSHSYFGTGLVNRDCGIKINKPASEDYGKWKCSVGLVGPGKNTTILQRVLLINGYSSKTRRTIILPNKMIISVTDKELLVTCNANTTISYCSVQHPNGTEFPPITNNEPDYPYWYPQKGLDVGICEIIIKNSTLNDSGTWTCYMGGRLNSPGIELKSEVQVKIGGPLVAIKSKNYANINETISLHCITAEGYKTLKYCRFSLPDGTRFNIDDRINSTNRLLGEYYFMRNASTKRGDCAITIDKVQKKHFGMWTCAAMINNDSMEFYDKVMIIEREKAGKSLASVAGMTVGIIIVFVLAGFAAIFAWKRRRSSRNVNESRRVTLGETVEFTGRVSGDSDTSSTHIKILPQLHSTPTYGASTSMPSSK